MTDIVERLEKNCPCSSDIGCADALCLEAATEITRLRAENERLREALDEIANGKLLFPNYSFWLRDRAREALKENSDE